MRRWALRVRDRVWGRPVVADDEKRQRDLAWERLESLRTQLRVIRLRQGRSEK